MFCSHSLCSKLDSPTSTWRKNQKCNLIADIEFNVTIYRYLYLFPFCQQLKINVSM